MNKIHNPSFLLLRLNNEYHKRRSKTTTTDPETIIDDLEKDKSNNPDRIMPPNTSLAKSIIKPANTPSASLFIRSSSFSLFVLMSAKIRSICETTKSFPHFNCFYTRCRPQEQESTPAAQTKAPHSGMECGACCHYRHLPVRKDGVMRRLCLLHLCAGS